MLVLRTLQRSIERSALTSARCARTKAQPCLSGVSIGSTAALPAWVPHRGLPRTPPVAGLLGHPFRQLANNTAEAGETIAEHASKLLKARDRNRPSLPKFVFWDPLVDAVTIVCWNLFVGSLVLVMAYPVLAVRKKDDIASMRVKNLLRGLGVPVRDVQLAGLSEEEVGAIEA